jgi:hypothetical protein
MLHAGRFPNERILWIIEESSVCLTAWLSRFKNSGIEVAGTLTLRRGVSGGAELKGFQLQDKLLASRGGWPN